VNVDCNGNGIVDALDVSTLQPLQTPEFFDIQGKGADIITFGLAQTGGSQMVRLNPQITLGAGPTHSLSTATA